MTTSARSAPTLSPASGYRSHNPRAHRFLASLLVTTAILCGPPVRAAVQDVMVSDVTTRAFSVVWVSDEPVLGGTTVRVFSDAGGLEEVTSDYAITLLSEAAPGAMENGIVKVDVVGLESDAVVYVQTYTVGASGVVVHPALGDLLEVRTAVRTRKGDDSGLPIVNDVVFHDVLDPDGATPGDGSLLVVDVPSISQYPLTAFVPEGFVSPTAAVDLNNLFDKVSRESARVDANTVLEVTEFRGLKCVELASHKLLRYRRAPSHEESPAITDLEPAGRCFFADTLCDDTVNILDVQRVLNVFNAGAGDCAFNPDMDIVADDVIDILDVQSVLNRFEESAPF